MKQVKILNQLGVIFMVMLGSALGCSNYSHARINIPISLFKQQVNPDNPEKRTFIFPDIPVMLQTPEERMKYLVRHYWDKFDFQDTVYIHLPDVTEQALVNYLDLLGRVPSKLSDECMTHMLTNASRCPKMMEYMVKTLRLYCMDPNSPLRNEEIYYPVACFLSRHAAYDEAVRSKAVFDLKKIRLNRKGSIANDFVYTTISGKQARMHQLSKDYTLLVFYDPDCESCKEQLNYMKNCPLFMNQSVLSKVDVLAFYADDQYDLWKAHLTSIPTEWINAYDADASVLSKGLYDLGAMPSFYLLDKNKRVILKDAPIQQIQSFLDANL